MFDQRYWDDRYESGQTGWDLGTVSTPLKAYFDQLSDRDVRILIPGAGNAYEAAYLLERGFTNVTVVDLSETVTRRLEERFANYLGKGLTICCEDFFAHQGQYDRIIEQTFFCALSPDLREGYARKMRELLVPGGKLVGVLFDRDFGGGPPFGGNRAEYEALFRPVFEEVRIEPCVNSIPPRAGSEVFIQLSRAGR